jgi:hypothetical protein
VSRAATVAASIDQPERKPRTRPLIDTVRNSTLSLVNCNSYLPADLIRKVKFAAIDRDTAIRLLNDSIESAADWPGDVVPISGASGVIAQVLSDHFAAVDEQHVDTLKRIASKPPAPSALPARGSVTTRRRRTRS